MTCLVSNLGLTYNLLPLVRSEHSLVFVIAEQFDIKLLRLQLNLLIAFRSHGQP